MARLWDGCTISYLVRESIPDDRRHRLILSPHSKVGCFNRRTRSCPVIRRPPENITLCIARTHGHQHCPVQQLAASWGARFYLAAVPTPRVWGGHCLVNSRARELNERHIRGRSCCDGGSEAPHLSSEAGSEGTSLSNLYERAVVVVIHKFLVPEQFPGLTIVGHGEG